MLSCQTLNCAWCAKPCGTQGTAVTRLVRRMRLQEPRSRLDKVRAKVQKAPRPLEGERFDRFEGMVLKDIGVLAKKGDLSPLQAADLMRRAVDSRALGASLSAPARDQLLLALEGARRTHASGVVELPAMQEESPAQADKKPRAKAINKLASGVVIDLTHNHEASIATLDSGQVADLLAALGLGAPSEDELRFDSQKRIAADWMKQPFSHMHNHAAARQASLGQDLPKDMLDRLDKAAGMANAAIGVTPRFNPDPQAPPQYKLEFRFNGSQDFKDARQNLRTAFGGVGSVYKATDTVAEIMAHLLKEHGHKYQIDLVSGVSLGGGAAQAFLAGLESRTPLRVSPRMVLLDPQLLNDAQAQFATRHGTYDFQKPRGVAISLDYPHKPRKSLMDIMKGPGGYRHPGLMQIKLGLTQGDGPDRGKNPGKPESMPLVAGLNLGYHADNDQFARAVRRFTGNVGELSAAGVQALIAKYGGPVQSPPPLPSEITPASPPTGQHASAADAGSVSLRDEASTDAHVQHHDPRAVTAHASATWGQLPAQDSPMPPPAKPKGVAINKLNSGVKLDLSRQPDATLASLQPHELGALVQFLRLGPPKSDEQELHAQKLQAKVLLEDLCDKLPDLADSPEGLHGPSAGLLKLQLPDGAHAKLLQAAKTAHCHVHVSRTRTDDGFARMRLEILFGAMENMQDAKQALKTFTGGTGPVYKATDEIAAILADQIREMKGRVEIGFVAGASMGGGAAQAFLAGLESRVRLPASPPLILLDPQLLNDAQSRHATRGKPFGYDFEKPRGIAISLDYDKAPRRGLMGIMKGPGGYTYPGLLHLKLGLKDKDGPDGGKPLAMPPGLGYHGVGEQFDTAIRRFTSALGNPPPPSFREPSHRDDGGSESPSAGSASLRDWESEDSASLASASMRSDRSGPSGM